MKWGVNEAERSGGLFQGAVVEPKESFFHFPWMHKMTGSASWGLEKRKKKDREHCARPKGGKAMVEAG